MTEYCCKDMGWYASDMERKKNVKLGPAIHRDKYGNLYFAHHWCIDGHPIRLILKFCPFCSKKLSYWEPPVQLIEGADSMEGLFSISGDMGD